MRAPWIEIPLGTLTLVSLLACFGETAGDEEDKDEADPFGDADTDADADSDADGDADSDSDADADADAEADADAAGDADTGLALGYFVGGWEASSTRLSSFEQGIGFYGADSEDLVCKVVASYTGGSKAEECPQCDWSFETSHDGDRESGSGCDGMMGLDGGDSLFQAYDLDEFWITDIEAVGVAARYEFSGDDPAENVMFIMYGGEWYIHAYSYATKQYVDGDEWSATFQRPWVFEDGGSYYYYAQFYTR